MFRVRITNSDGGYLATEGNSEAITLKVVYDSNLAKHVNTMEYAKTLAAVLHAFGHITSIEMLCGDRWLDNSQIDFAWKQRNLRNSGPFCCGIADDLTYMELAKCYRTFFPGEY